MGAPVEGAGTGGCRRQDVRDILQGSSTGDATIWVGDVGVVPMHQDDAGRISPPGDLTTDGLEADTAGGWDLLVPTSGGSNGRIGIGGGGELRHQPPKHILTVHRNQTHYGSVNNGGLVPRSTGLPAVVVTGVSRLGGDTGGVKGGGYVREGGGGGQRRAIISRGINVAT